MTAVQAPIALAQTLGGAFKRTWQAMGSDVAALLLLFVGGLVYSFFYPLPYSRELVQGMPVAVVDEDQSSLSRQITRYAQAHPMVQVVAVVPEMKSAQALVLNGQAVGALLLPRKLQADVLAGRAAEVVINGHGAYLLANKAALNGLAEVVGTVSAGIEIKRLHALSPSDAQVGEWRDRVPLNAVALFNPREGYGSYVVPAVFVLVLQQTLLMAMALMFGTWREDRSLPFARTSRAYLGVWLAFASVVFINGLYDFGFALWWQDYPRSAQLWPLLGFLTVFALATSAFGMCVGQCFKTRERGSQLLLATSLPILFMSGATWPVQGMPVPLAALAWCLPSTPGIQGFLAINQMGASWGMVDKQVLALLAMATVYGLIGWWTWRHPAESGDEPIASR